MNRSGSHDFWHLQYYLPQETRNHVKKYISTHYYFEGNGGVTTMTKTERLKIMHQNANATTLSKRKKSEEDTSLRLRGKYFNAETICGILGINKDEFDKLNPHFDEELFEGNMYEMILPKDKMQSFLDKRQLVIEQSIDKLLSK
uniref:CAZy families GH23 protein n=1 Tax=uncultured Chitinophaga sp. TaxID=339340 RepID=A0A060CEN0_9BACT|nr:CAZy families GH23 protein [uncultured Chitinophaga sp.]